MKWEANLYKKWFWFKIPCNGPDVGYGAENKSIAIHALLKHFGRCDSFIDSQGFIDTY